ncbi:metalloregulator ArsR/SmtB family transcription factor (plasmid) [Rhodococcus pyridinivorans]|uniref:ArsR/SmtB family transcription factor n=1 Tax=Rhodococcus TaxID=1827 RepID=UPI00200B38D8|nr:MULTISPECIES: metalloregulator ArsR/SmtB family transcription factor [Rhodococcus]MDV6296689.1 metalloregulator ArsR/SmtB family transcription factor [Rhodococcus aetherivorans]UPW06930.1 metalloregulator ArsR/SmtB family transcription factor [Rhodococcus pyridinivorans]
MESPRSPVFDALADPTRREILLFLSAGELPVGDIAECIPGLGRTTISSHLRVLRMAGLVKERRDGRYRYYSVDPAPALQLVDFVTQVYKDSLHELDVPAFAAESGEEAGSHTA